MYRQAWAASKIDLRKISGKPEVRFAHSNGFYAAIDNSLGDREITELIDCAIL